MSGHEHERLSAYLDGELAPPEQALVTAHLAACAECTARLAELAAVDEAASALPAEAPPGYFETLPARVRARLDARAPQRRERRLPVWAWAAAAALLVAVVAPLTLRQKPAAEMGRIPAPSPVVTPAPAAAPAEARAEREAQVPEEAKRELPRATPPPAVAKAARPPAAGFARAPLPEAQAPVARSAVADEASREDSVAVSEQALATSAGEARAEPARAAQPATLGAQAPAAPAEAAAAGTMASRARGGPEDEFQRLNATRPLSAADWRALRESWRRFASAQPNDLRADEARVRTIEAGYEAWRAAGDAADETLFRSDAAAYLARDDAAQKERVYRLLR